MAQIWSIVNAMTMPFHGGDPNMVKRVCKRYSTSGMPPFAAKATTTLLWRTQEGSDPEPCGSSANAESECAFFGRFLANFKGPFEGVGLTFFLQNW